MVVLGYCLGARNAPRAFYGPCRASYAIQPPNKATAASSHRRQQPPPPAATAAAGQVPLPLDGADCAAVGGLSALLPPEAGVKEGRRLPSVAAAHYVLSVSRLQFCKSFCYLVGKRGFVFFAGQDCRIILLAIHSFDFQCGIFRHFCNLA